MTNRNSKTQPVFLKPYAGPTLSFFNVKVAYKLTSVDTDGQWSLLEYTLPPNFAGPTLHWHKLTSEVFYVQSGFVSFQIGDKTVLAEQDSLVYIPKGVLHTFSNPKEGPARFLMFLIPGGLEEYFKDAAAMAQSDTAWTSDELCRFHALYEKYDTYF